MLINKSIKQSGQTLIEVVVALGLMATISISVLGILVQAQVLNLSTKQRIEATVISDKLLEEARSARNLLWEADQGKKYHLKLQSGDWQLVEGEVIDDIYTNWFEIDPVKRDINGEIAESGTVDPAMLKLTSYSRWQKGIERTVSQTTLVSRHIANHTWIQTDWSGGPGQEQWLNDTRYDQDDENLDVSIQPGDVSLAKKGRGGWQSGPKTLASLDLGSKVNDIIVEGHRAFLAGQKSDQSLMVVDISQKKNPQLVRTLNLSGPVRGFYKQGNYLYCAIGNVGNGLAIIDITNPDNPILAGSVSFGGEGNEIFVDGNYAYIAGSGANQGLIIVDISDPGNPNQISTLDVGSKGNDVYVDGDRAYLAVDDSSQSFVVVNVADRHSPSLMTSMATDGIINRLAGKPSANQVYAVTNNSLKGLEIIDISTPSSPFISHEIELYNSGQAVYEVDDYIYLGITDNNFGFGIVDNADKDNPTRIGEENVEDSVRAVYGQGDYAYVGTDDPQNGFAIVDVFSKMNVATVASVDVGEKVNGLAAKDNYVYNATAHNWNSFIVADVEDPFNARIYSLLSLIGKPVYEATVLDNFSYICVDKSKGGMQVVNISFPIIPFIIGVGNIDSKGNDVAVKEDWAFVATNSNTEGLQSVDTDPKYWPRVRDAINISGKGMGVAIDDFYAYLASDNPNEGLVVVDISDPYNLVKVGGVNIGEAANDIFIAGNYAYLATNSGLRVVDVSDPANPSFVGFFPTPYAVNRLAVSDDFVFLACDDPIFGLLVVDASKINNLELANKIKVNGRASDVEVSGNFASVGIDDPNNGLQIVWNGGGEEAGDRYARSGELTSSTYSLDFESVFNRIDWTGEEPSQTNLKFQLAIKSQIGDSWQWFGPDGTDQTYFQSGQDQDIPIELAKGRYIRYRLVLDGPGTRTPILGEVRINYSK